MMKTLRYLFLAVLTMTFGMAQADDIVINFNEMDIPTSHSKNDELNIEASSAGDINDEDWTYTQDGVTIVVTPKTSGSNPNRFWETSEGPQLRCYSGTITIAYTSSMKNITFAAPNKFNLSANTGNIEDRTWTGSGETQRVVFTVNANTQINSITITPGVGDAQGGGEDPVDEEVIFNFTENDYGLPHINADNNGNNDWYYLNNGTLIVSNQTEAQEEGYTLASTVSVVSGDVTCTVNGEKGCRLWDSFTNPKEGEPEFTGTDFRLYQAGTLTLSVPSGQIIKKVVFTGSKVSKLNGPGNIPLVSGTWEGALNAPSFTCSETQQIKTITITYGEGEEQQVVTTYTDMTIADLNATTEKNIKNVNLKLNNALVVYVNGNNAFVREGDKAVQFFKMGNVEEGMTLTGDIKCDYTLYSGCPEVVGITDVTNLNDVQTGTATVTPTEATVAEINNIEHMADLVVLRDVKITIDDKNYYAVDVTGAQVQIYDKYKLNIIPTEPGEEVYEVIGIFGTIYKEAPEIYVTAINAPGATAIQTIQKEQAEGTVFNLQGQRVSQPTHGIYIVNGKKIMMK